MARDPKIAEIAVDLIRKSSMKHDQWRATSIGVLHADPPLPLTLERDELPLVSAAFAEGDWYAWTTRRLVAVCEGKRYEIPAESIVRAEFGIFKGPPQLMHVTTGPIHTLIANVYSASGLAARIRYETGYASMGPVQCLKYWELKHPILDKLMTPTERTAHRQQRDREWSE